MNRLTLLDELQTLDIRIEENLHARKQLEAHLADETTVDAGQKAYDAATRQEHDLRAGLRNLELEVKGLDDQIRQVDGRLYGGKVTNAKELSGLNRDEDMLKRHKGELEDKMLELMARLETAEAAVAAQRANLDHLKTTRVAETNHDRAKLQTLEATAAQLDQARRDLRTQIPIADLQVYDALYQSKRGRAIAHIKGSSCAACGYAIPSGIASRARVGEELVFCVNCDRILISQ